MLGVRHGTLVPLTLNDSTGGSRQSIALHKGRRVLPARYGEPTASAQTHRRGSAGAARRRGDRILDSNRAAARGADESYGDVPSPPAKLSSRPASPRAADGSAA